MTNLTVKKNKVELSDYDYQKDIENRIFLAELSLQEVDVLTEIINGSLKIMIDHLADDLDLSSKELRAILNKLLESHLFEIKGELILVDKEMRKYYETQIVKFDEEFKPDMEYLQGLLSKAPISSLPNWYAIPRSSDHIFKAIVENFLFTPKIYRRYLSELQFDDANLSAIIQEVAEAPGFTICSQKLLKKLKISRRQFEEYMLLLEFNFVCCITYKKSKDVWEEMVTPFHEWKEYCLFLNENKPKAIKDTKSISPSYKGEFGFLKKLNTTLKATLKKAVSLKDLDEAIVNVLVEKELVSIDKDQIKATALAKEWFALEEMDQAIFIYKILLKDFDFSDKDYREAEKSLHLITDFSWVYLEDYMKGCLSIVGSSQPIALKNKGKRWKYELPCYNKEEKAFIETVLTQKLMQAGMVETGLHEDKVCLRLTPFGKSTIL